MTLRYEHLKGLPFQHGTSDCYSIARNFYKDNFDLDLPDFARPENWWEKGLNLYMDHFYDAGFRILDIHPRDWIPGDAFLMSILSNTTNHCGMYLGGNSMLHHLYGQLSSVVTYSNPWRNRTTAVVRHKDITPKMITPKQFDISSVLSPVKKRELGIET